MDIYCGMEKDAKNMRDMLRAIGEEMGLGEQEEEEK